MMDPWVITPEERARHTQQFQSVMPENGFITGSQAKGFFVQSNLPPMVLAQIWGLADMNGDGRMDFNEFSIACKLINLKLKGMEIPKSLPPQMLAVPPNHLALGAHMPMQAGMPGMGMGMGMGGMMGGQPRMPNMMPGMMGMQQQVGMMPPHSMMGMTSMSAGMQPMGGGGMINTMPGMMGHPNPGMMGMGMMPGVAVPGVQPSLGTMMMSGTPTPPPTTGVPSPVPAAAAVEWAIPQQKRVGYMAQFQANDKARTGFLAAVQARNLLLQTGLAQQTLATVWNLADIDKDGRLSCEEFMVAMHLCEMAMKGEPLPPQLPIRLVPPSLRKNHPSAGVSTPGSVQSGSNEEALSPASFEDKRRENWEAGQQELQKRRASLLEQQKRDEETRKKKEKEEAEARDKQKKEMERQRMEEWERSRKAELEQHRQRETENVIMLRAKKETANQELEALKAKMAGLTDSITEARTGVTDVKLFIDGMRTSRDTKMAELNAIKNQLKEQNQRLLQVTQEKARLEAKNKVNQLKLQEGRDLEITDFDLKKQDKEEKLVQLREQATVLKEEEDSKREAVETNKKILMEHREKLKKMIEACKALHEGFEDQRKEVKAEKMKKIRELTDPEHAWGKEGEGGEEEEDAWAVSSPAAEEAPAAAAEAVAPDTPAADPSSSATVSTAGYLQYRALYDYEARNADELSFHVEDIILVHPGQEHEPGWLGGELRGRVGWFPEAYAEKIVEGGEQTLQPIAEVPENGSDSGSYQSQVIREESIVEGGGGGGVEDGEDSAAVSLEPEVAPATAAETTVAADDATPQQASDPSAGGEVEYEQYVAVYPYQSGEPGDLVFEAGDLVLVSSKDGDWWTGQCNGQTGVFPFNYVEPAPKQTDKGKKMEIATVMAPYTATSKEQLSLAQGQMVLIRKKTETGWWQGELSGGGKGKKRAVGWFPASYVKLLEGGGAAPPATSNGGGGGDKTAPAPGTAGGEKYVALFDYVAQYEDELSFSAGEVVVVVSREESDWWRGEVNGRTGVFPSNYVQPAP